MSSDWPQEQPIKTGTAVHPFDAMELELIRFVCTTATEDGEVLLTESYAAAVMPALADKIEQLRTLLCDREDRLAHAAALFEEMSAKLALMRKGLELLAQDVVEDMTEGNSDD